jgi:hypothetical protein
MNAQYVSVRVGQPTTQLGVLESDADAFVGNDFWNTTVHGLDFIREVWTLEQAIAENPKGLLLFANNYHYYVDGECKFAEELTWVVEGEVKKNERRLDVL